MTAQRQLVLDIINRSYYHLNAEQIFMEAKKEMNGIAMATIYNSLKYLSENGFIKHIGRSDGADFYDKSIIPHDHIICDVCGAITDIESGNIKETLEASIGSPISFYELNAHYTCPSCAQNVN